MRCAFVLATAALLGPAAARAAESDCAPWPGEPSALPTVASPDSVLARWATLRAAELAAMARAGESASPARANRLWRHVLCLDPASADAKAALEQARLVHVHRPDVVVGRGASAPEAGTVQLRLDDPIRVVSREPRAPAPSTTPPSDWTRTDAALRGAEGKLREADFEAALASAQRVARQLGDSNADPGGRERRARAEVVAATAQVALGREDEARRSFERALQADPGLRLDPATTSPKVRRAFDAALAAKGRTP